MELRADLDIRCPDDVYPPSEDSELLIRSLDVRPGERVLEVGCGTGIVAIHCALAGAEAEAVDVNPSAVRCTLENAKAAGARIRAHLSDLFSSVDGTFDTVAFNLPYLPVSDEGMLARAWSGGPDGLGPLPALLAGAPAHLREGGRVVIVVSSLMDAAALDAALEGLEVRELGSLPLFFERLRVLEVRGFGRGRGGALDAENSEPAWAIIPPGAFLHRRCDG